MDGANFKKTFKTRLITGLFVTFPIVLTILAIVWLFGLLDGILGRYLDMLLGRHYPGLGLVVYVIGVLIVGTFATTVLGRKILVAMEKMVLRVPIMKSLYSTFKQLSDAFSPHNRGSFKKFVIVEYPRQGVQAFGFLTKECVIENKDGIEECFNAVYIPTNNLYLGDIALFRREEVLETGLPIEEGIKIILSAGIATPNIIKERTGIYESMAGLTGERPQVGTNPAVKAGS